MRHWIVTRRMFGLAIGMVICLGGGLAGLAAPPRGAFYPLEVGDKWTYVAGPYELVEEVTQIDVVDGEKCARVETSMNGKRVAYEHLAARPDGIYRVSIAGERVVPPLCFLKYSEGTSMHWTVSSRVSDQEITGEFASEASRVKVPAGEYQTLTVHGTKFESAAGPLELTYYFAPGVGKVKQVISSSGKSAQLELKSYQPAPKPGF